MIAPLWIIKPASVAPSTSSSPSSSSSAGIESVEIYFPSPADSPDPYIRGITLKFDGETGEHLPEFLTVEDVF